MGIKEVKGAVILKLVAYVDDEFPDWKSKWISSLSPSAREVLSSDIQADAWYCVQTAYIEPTKSLAGLLSIEPDRMAFMSGKNVADRLLKGVYKVFVAIASPSFVFGRATMIMNSFFRKGKIDVVAVSEKEALIKIEGIEDATGIIEFRIAGFISTIINKCTSKEVKVSFIKTTRKGDAWTEYLVEW